MKVTIVHNDHKRRLLVSTKTLDRLLERIARDDSKQTVTQFRQLASHDDSAYLYYKDMPTWMHIYPAAEFTKDENGNLKMKNCNGILLPKFANITDTDGLAGVKSSVGILPSTLAVLEGADGKSVIILVKFSDEKGSLPTSEAEAELLYRIAYQQIYPIYQAVAKASLTIDGPKASIVTSSALSGEPSMHNSFLMTMDALPYYNSKAVAMKVDSHVRSQALEQDAWHKMANVEDDVQGNANEPEKKSGKSHMQLFH